MSVMAQAIGSEIVEALGLPKDSVSAIDLRFRSGEVVTATVELAPGRDQLDRVTNILRRYELHEKPEALAANG